MSHYTPVIGNPFLQTPVLLSPISEDQVSDSNLEPQMVRVKQNNTSVIVLSSDDPQTRLSPLQNNTWLVGNVNGSSRSLNAKGFSRIAFQTLTIQNFIPNINLKNNKVSVQRSSDNAIFTVTVPENFYTSQSQLTTALVTTLNSIAIVSGMTFNCIPIFTGSTSYWQLNCVTTVGGVSFPFRFADCSFIEYGYAMFGFNNQRNTGIFQVLPYNNFFRFGPVSLNYTSYIDIRSRAVTQFAKIGVIGSNTDLLFRVYLFDDNFDKQILVNVGNRAWYNFNPTFLITEIDISFYDEFGDPLYIPGTNIPGVSDYGRITWNIIISVEK